MDTPTLLTLLSILAAIFVGIVVFWVVRRFLISVFSGPHRIVNTKINPTLELSEDQTYPSPVQMRFDSAEIKIVDLPRKPKLTGKEDIDLDALCFLTIKRIRDCNCPECQDLRRRAQ